MTTTPNGWETRALGTLGQAVRLSVTPEAQTTYELWSVPSFSEGSPEIVNGSAIGSAKLRVEQGDVLICKINPRINRVWRVRDVGSTYESIASPEWLVFRPSDEVDGEYLRLCLTAPEFRNYIAESVSGVTGSHTRAKADRILRFEVPLPPLDEQRRIVAILEDHLSRLDAAVDALDAIELKARLLLASAFEACASPKRGKHSDEPWQTLRFGDIASIDADLRDPKDYTDWPHIAPNHIEKDTGRLLEYKTIGDDGVTSPKHAFRSGQILYSKIRPYLNKVALPNFDGLCSADMYPISTEQDVEWLYYAMLSPSFVRKTSRTQNRTVLPKINAGALRAVEVMVPPARQQVGLRLVASKVARAVERIESSVAVARTRANTLRGALLWAAFSGQLTKEAASV